MPGSANTLPRLFILCLLLFCACTTSAAQVSVEIGTGSIVEITGNINVDVTGNWQNHGVFICGKSNVSFLGPWAQVLSVSSNETFYDLSVNKTAKPFLAGNDIVIQHRLNLANGVLNASRSVVTVNSKGEIKRGGGYVIGSLMKKGLSRGNWLFETGTLTSYSPVELNIESGSGDITVSSFDGAYDKVSGTSVLQRYWNIQNSGNTRGDIRFSYAAHDISGIENNYVAGCFTEKWLFPKTTVYSLLHTAHVKGVIQSGDWTLGGRDALYPSQIALKYSLNANKIVLSWQVPSGYRNYNFTVERADYWLKDWKPVAGMEEIQKESGGNYTCTDSPPTGKFLYRLKQTAADGDLQYTDEIEVRLEHPGSFSLEQNFPNPFNSETKITYSLPQDTKVYLAVFSVTGQAVAELVNEFQSAGSYTLSFDASSLSSGTYLYKIMAGSFVQTKKMVILR